MTDNKKTAKAESATPPAPAPAETAAAARPAARAASRARTAKPAQAATPAKAAKPAKAVKTVKAAKAPKPVKAAQPPAAAKAVKAATKPAKPKKPKLVRDSFTIPKDEYQVLDELKQRTAKLGHVAKKSELLRAGIKALAGLDATDLLAALARVPAIKTGRPKQA